MIKGPSPRHVWRYVSQHVDKCLRCGSHYHRLTDGAHGAFYCAPTPQWLKEHPDDDKEQR